MDIGIIDNVKLVEYFGTDKNKLYFLKNKKINTSLKNTLLKRACCKCEIEDLGGGKYDIKKIRDEEIPYNVYVLNNGMNKYLAPMILNKILYDYSENNAYVTTIFNYANTIGMTNKNYSYIKKYKTSATNKYNLEIDNVYSYYKYVDNSIKYYISSTLENLKKCGVIKYDDPYMIIYRNAKDLHDISTINISYKDSCRIATSLEVRHHTDIEARIRKDMNINSDKEAFFSNKSSEYKKRLLNELMNNPLKTETGEEIVILLLFKGYRIWYTTVEKCENLLKNLTSEDTHTLIEKFNNEFIKLTLSNLKNKYIDSTSLDKIKIDYETLSNLTLNYFLEDIKLDETPKLKHSKCGGVNMLEIITNEY